MTNYGLSNMSSKSSAPTKTLIYIPSTNLSGINFQPSDVANNSQTSVFSLTNDTKTISPIKTQPKIKPLPSSGLS